MAENEKPDDDLELDQEQVQENDFDEDLDNDAEGEGGESVESSGDTEDDENEREAIRARRREERKHKKEAIREREATMRRELAARDAIINEMRERLNAVERRNQGSEVAQIDNAIQDSANAYNYWKQQIAIGTQTMDGNVVAEATEKMLLAQRKFEELNRVRNGYQQRQQQPTPLDPRLAQHAKGWMEKNKWYNPAGTDIDSKVALAIDTALAEEGWNPTTPQYWEELDSRVKKYLPHRAAQPARATRTNSPVAGSGRDSAPAKSSGTYKLAPERVQAIKDAGMWNDPAKRDAMIKSYQDYDRANGLA